MSLRDYLDPRSPRCLDWALLSLCLFWFGLGVLVGMTVKP